MDVIAHMFRHVEEDPVHRKVADPKRQGRITEKGFGQTVDVGTILEERIPDRHDVEVRVLTSHKMRAIATALAPYLRLRNRFKRAMFREPVEDPELDLPKGDPKIIGPLFEQMGRDAYLQAFVEGKLPPGIEPAAKFDRRISARSLGRAKRASLKIDDKERHLVIVTHDGGTKVASGFGATFAKLTKLDPQEIVEPETNYKGPMRNGEYIGVKYHDGRAVWAEFRGRLFAPSKRGKPWAEVAPG